MAKNILGFIPKRYKQPDYYKELFGSYNAVYIADNDKEFMIEACTHFLCSEKIGERIEHLQILRQDKDGRRVLCPNIKTFKEAVSIIEHLLNKNKS